MAGIVQKNNKNETNDWKVNQVISEYMGPERVKRFQSLIATGELKIQLVLASEHVEIDKDFLDKFPSAMFTILPTIYLTGDRHNDLLMEKVASNKFIDNTTLVAILSGGGKLSSSYFQPLMSQEAVDAVQYLKLCRKAFVGIGIGHKTPKYNFPICSYADIPGDSPMEVGIRLNDWVEEEMRNPTVFNLLNRMARRRAGLQDIGSQEVIGF